MMKLEGSKNSPDENFWNYEIHTESEMAESYMLLIGGLDIRFSTELKDPDYRIHL